MSQILKASRSAADPVEKARSSWGPVLPDWVLVLAETCQRSTQTAVAKRLNYSPSVVSAVLSNAYQKGDMVKFEQMVRGALMSETVACPELGDIARNQCLDWQAKPYAPTSSQRVRMYRACRDRCRHSRISSDQGDDDAF